MGGRPVDDEEEFGAPKRIKIMKNEMTCLGCGETFPSSIKCPRCTLDEEGNTTNERPPSVATLTYLQEGEWEYTR